MTERKNVCEERGGGRERFFPQQRSIGTRDGIQLRAGRYFPHSLAIPEHIFIVQAVHHTSKYKYKDISC